MRGSNAEQWAKILHDHLRLRTTLQLVPSRNPSPPAIKFLKFGLPFLLLVVGGSFGLSEFAAVGVKKRDEKTRSLTADEVQQLQTGKKTTLEDAHQELIKKLDISDWENVRVPRPWDE